MKRYKLLKDLPTFNAGDEFVLRDNGCLYLNKVDAVKGWLTGVGHWKNDVMAYHKRTLEQFPNILEDWFEEIKEPKEDGLDNIITLVDAYNTINSEAYPKEIVEKLKAWKRLKDNGLVIKKWSHTPDMHLTTGSFLKIEGFIPSIMKNIKDLNLLFGGEE